MTDATELTEREELLLRALIGRITLAARDASGDRDSVPLRAFDEAMRTVQADLPTFAAVALQAPLGIDGRPLSTGRLFGTPPRPSRVTIAMVRLEVLSPLLAQVRDELRRRTEDYHRSSERLRLSGVVEGLRSAEKEIAAAVDTEAALVRASRRAGAEVEAGRAPAEGKRGR